MTSTHDQMISLGLVKTGQSLRLHLGCGETLIDGYINVDYPQTSHSVMRVQADFQANIIGLSFPENSVDEIRLHHVFEHFNRVTALGLLLRWRNWLKPGGLLWIETPDMIATASVAAGLPVKDQIALARHLEGDQAANWAYHIGQWFPARFLHTFTSLGFTNVSAESHRSKWHTLPLYNVTAKATKDAVTSQNAARQNVVALLADSLVSPLEVQTLAAWTQQLDTFLDDAPMEQLEILESKNLMVRQSPVVELVANMERSIGKEPSISQIHSFNPVNRDLWVRACLAGISPGARVLDVGAGSCPYKIDLEHTRYESHDFKQYEGYRDPNRGEGLYGTIDHISDILNLPLASETYDYALCTEVLEHVPDPIGAIAEMSRVIKHGGRLIITAPLSSGLHQEPYHFYGGYTPHWYRMVASRFGLEVVEITPNGGFFNHLAQECARVAWTLPKHQSFHSAPAIAVGTLFGELLPRYLSALDESCPMPEFTVGYHVILRRI